MMDERKKIEPIVNAQQLRGELHRSVETPSVAAERYYQSLQPRRIFRTIRQFARARVQI